MAADICVDPRTACYPWDIPASSLLFNCTGPAAMSTCLSEVSLRRETCCPGHVFFI